MTLAVKPVLFLLFYFFAFVQLQLHPLQLPQQPPPRFLRRTQKYIAAAMPKAIAAISM